MVCKNSCIYEILGTSWVLITMTLRNNVLLLGFLAAAANPILRSGYTLIVNIFTGGFRPWCLKPTTRPEP